MSPSPANISSATERRQGLMEALACFCGAAAAVAFLYGLNAMTTPTTLNMTAMLAN